MTVINQAIKKFLEWNRKHETTRLEKHEALKAILMNSSQSGRVEVLMPYSIKGRPRRGRIDFLDDQCAVEIDHSMKQRSLIKLLEAKKMGLKPVWIIIRPTNSYPRKYGRVKRRAEKIGIQVILLRNLSRK